MSHPSLCTNVCRCACVPTSQYFTELNSDRFLLIDEASWVKKVEVEDLCVYGKDFGRDPEACSNV